MLGSSTVKRTKYTSLRHLIYQLRREISNNAIEQKMPSNPNLQRHWSESDRLLLVPAWNVYPSDRYRTLFSYSIRKHYEFLLGFCASGGFLPETKAAGFEVVEVEGVVPVVVEEVVIAAEEMMKAAGRTTSAFSAAAPLWPWQGGRSTECGKCVNPCSIKRSVNWHVNLRTLANFYLNPPMKQKITSAPNIRQFKHFAPKGLVWYINGNG